MRIDELFKAFNEHYDELDAIQLQDVYDALALLALDSIRKQDHAATLRLIRKYKQFEIDAKLSTTKGFIFGLVNIMEMAYTTEDTSREILIASLQRTTQQLREIMKDDSFKNL